MPKKEGECNNQKYCLRVKQNPRDCSGIPETCEVYQNSLKEKATYQILVLR